jgi:pyruvate formate lyase activating enzyme
MDSSPDYFRSIPIAGMQAMTTIDFPGRISAILFTRGCLWNCRYCHNSGLRHDGETIQWDRIEAFLMERRGFIEGVVVSGGEPTLHRELPALLAWLRGMGYATAIHTNGSSPAMLLHILKKGLADYVAMDIKAPPAAYDRITRISNTCIEVSRSISIILESGVEHEFRTTWHPAVLSESELMDIVHNASNIGIKRYFLQRFQGVGVEDGELAESQESYALPPNVVDEARRLFAGFEVR